MSRYSDIYESNVQGSYFTALVAEVNMLPLGDISQTDFVLEAQRLKKVVGYLVDVLNSIDPELVPIVLWDAFPQYARSALENLRNYVSTKNVVYIQNANNSVDNLLNLVRPYMILKGKTKSVLENVFQVTENNLEQFVNTLNSKSDETLTKLDTHLISSQETAEEIEKVNSSILEAYSKVIGNGTNDGLIELIETSLKNVVLMEGDITDLHDKLLVGKNSTENQIKTFIEEIEETRIHLGEISASVDKEVKELREFYVRVFGKLHDDDEEPAGGLSHEITERLSQLRELETTNKNRYEAIRTQIESLLPGATSAGLATAYRQMKRSYQKPIIFFNRLFYLAIFLLVCVSLYSIFEISDIQTIVSNSPANNTASLSNATTITESNALIHPESWEGFVKSFIKKIPLFGALIWFAFFVSKRRSEAQRLQEEYAHKEALAKSYASYKKQIEALDTEDKELQKEFILKMIDAIAFNASQTLDGNHGDKHPFQTVLEKISEKIEGTISPSELLDLFKKRS